MRRTRRCLAIPRAAFAACLACATLAGCGRSLFQDKDPRTQFETYDRMRQRFVPTEVLDEFGRPRPALRERLAGR